MFSKISFVVALLYSVIFLETSNLKILEQVDSMFFSVPLELLLSITKCFREACCQGEMFYKLARPILLWQF